MDYIVRHTKLGDLYVSKKTQKMVLNYQGRLIHNQNQINKLFIINRIPIKVQYEITEKCNFNCYYCYAESIRNQKELTTDEVKMVIDRLYNMGIVFLELTGGEVFTRKDICEILDYAYEKDFLISIFSNISLINKEIVEHMQAVYLVSTSLLAPNKERCDKLTSCNGGFEKIVEGIKLLQESKIKFEVQASITKENVDILNEYREFENKLKIGIIYNLNVAPTFSGFNCVKKYSLTESDIKQLRGFLDKDYMNKVKDFYDKLQCGIGESKFAIDCSGNVLPCIKYRKVLGNILKCDFSKLWNSDILNLIIKEKNYYNENEECLKCNKRSYCLPCIGMKNMYESKNDICNNTSLLMNLVD